MNKIEITNDPERYENIFNVYEFMNSNNDTYVFYNILSKVSFPDDLDVSTYDFYKVESTIPLTTLSYKLYKTQHLWWLILAVNKIKNPVKLLESGSVLKIIKPEYLDTIFNLIKEKK
jgi:hypothetical protein